MKYVLAVLAMCLCLPVVGADKKKEDRTANLYFAANGLYNRMLYGLAAEEYEKFLAKYATHPKAVSAQFGLSLSYFGLKKYDKAVPLLTKLAANGAAPQRDLVCLYLGQSLLKLKRIPEAKTAFNAGIKLSKPGDVQTLMQRGLLGIPLGSEILPTKKLEVRRWSDALKGLGAKAVNGDVNAQYTLGVMYEGGGGGVSADLTEAEKWYRKAAEQGHAAAQHNLGMRLYLKSLKYRLPRAVTSSRSLGFRERSDSTPPSERQVTKEAVIWFHKAAAQGYTASQSELGYLYRNGIGVKKSGREAEKWYRKAAEQGDYSAHEGLGDLYKNGALGVLQDDEESERWYRKGADVLRKSAGQGDADAQSTLGGLYAKGQGVGKDYIEAYAWWNIAAYFGSSEAKLERDILIGKAKRPSDGTRLLRVEIVERRSKLTRPELLEAQKLSRQLLSQIEGKKTGKPPIDPEKFPAPKIDPETGLPIRAKQK